VASVERASPHSIRVAAASDAAVIADLIRRAFAAQPRPTDPPSSALKETAAIVDDLGGTGQYTIDLEPISATFNGEPNGPPSPVCARGDDGTQAIACGQALSRRIDAPGETDTFTFTAQTGEMVSISVLPVPSGSSSPADEAEREARRRGLPRMTLGVRLELEENRQLFRSCGFEDLEFRCHEGYTEPTWVLMERRLT